MTPVCKMRKSGGTGVHTENHILLCLDTGLFFNTGLQLFIRFSGFYMKRF